MMIKMCPPFLEAMTSGYLIPAPFDFWVEPAPTSPTGFEQIVDEDTDPEWAPVVESVDARHFSGSPWSGVVRLRSFWNIEPPPGYSSYLTTPLIRTPEEAPFEILPKLVDTDKPGAGSEVLAVFRKPPPFEVRAGTPLIQVVPIFRDEWEHDLYIWDEDKVEEIGSFRDQYWDPENRRFDEGADKTRPDQGWGAFHKLVKVPVRYR